MTDPMALSNKDRQRTLRQRRHKAGLVRLEVWVPKSLVKRILAYVAKLEKP